MQSKSESQERQGKKDFVPTPRRNLTWLAMVIVNVVGRLDGILDLTPDDQVERTLFIHRNETQLKLYN